MAPNVVCWLVDDLRIFLELHIGHSWKQLVHLNKQNNIHQPSEANLHKYYEQFCKIHRKNTCAGTILLTNLLLLKTVSGTGVLLVNFSQFEEYCFLGCLRVAAFEPLIIYSF